MEWKHIQKKRQTIRRLYKTNFTLKKEKKYIEKKHIMEKRYTTKRKHTWIGDKYREGIILQKKDRLGIGTYERKHIL